MCCHPRKEILFELCLLRRKLAAQWITLTDMKVTLSRVPRRQLCSHAFTSVIFQVEVSWIVTPCSVVITDNPV